MPKGHYLAESVKDAIWVLRAEGVSEAEIARPMAGSLATATARRGEGIEPSKPGAARPCQF